MIIELSDYKIFKKKIKNDIAKIISDNIIYLRIGKIGKYQNNCNVLKGMNMVLNRLNYIINKK